MSVTESGFADFEAYAWWGLFAPSRTPQFIINRVAAYYVPAQLAERAWTSWLLIVPIVGLVVLGNSLLIYFVR
jgi:hypothetical protein